MAESFLVRRGGGVRFTLWEPKAPNIMNHPFAIFQPMGNIKIDVVLTVIPFAKWHEAANNDEFTSQPRKY